LPAGGPPSFRISGTMHHLVSSAFLPDSDRNNNFLCIYFHDTTHELENRLKHAPGSNERYKTRLNRYGNLLKHPLILLDRLQKEIRECNPFVEGLKSSLEQLPDDAPNMVVVIKAGAFSGDHCFEQSFPRDIFILLFSVDNEALNSRNRQYNVPTADEVAVIMPGPEHAGTRDIILFKKGGGCKFINNLHQNYDTWAYVLFHAHGDEGWKKDIPLCNISRNAQRKTVTVRQYYAHRLMVRPENNTCFHHPVGFLIQVLNTQDSVSQCVS